MRLDPSRRQFLHRTLLVAGTISIAGSPLIALAEESEVLAWRGQRQRVRPGKALFPQSVASFEPRFNSIIAWTRVQDADFPGQDLPLTLLVATDPWFTRIVAASEVLAHASQDGTVQVKLAELKPNARYYYRFVYEKGGQYFGSPIGRGRTAPDANDRKPARFALCCCQDAVGRYYNTYLAALPQDLDFVLFIGDYIYETTGDPAFQSPGGRTITFSDLPGAIALKSSGGQTYHAAASLSNYRELYRFYRSDPLLQRMHERFPFIVVWDDHEYANDCWGDTANYFDGRKDERDPSRRRNAEKAFFEYIAVDVGGQTEGQIDAEQRPLYPETRIYRDFRWGENLHLILTDYRSYRPDHLIPEDAFPGTVAVDRGALTVLLAANGIAYDSVKERFAPYIDLAAPETSEQDQWFPIYRRVLTTVLAQAYQQAGLGAEEAAVKAAATILGKLDVTVVNQSLSRYNASQEHAVPVIEDVSGLDRGIAFLQMGKTDLFSSVGARYFVVKPAFDLYAAYRTVLLNDPAAEDPYGAAQFEWIKQTLSDSNARCKLVVNSTSLTSMVLDLTGENPGLPQEIKDIIAKLPLQLRNRFYFNLDQFDGFPHYRRKLLDLYAQHDGVALLSGDIHASFAARHPSNLWEFTGPAVSSGTATENIRKTVLSNPVLSNIPAIVKLADQLDVLLPLGNPEIEFTRTDANGVVTFVTSDEHIEATYWLVDGKYAATSYYDRPLRFLSKLVPKRIDNR
jgi:alkaline phosphatase D